MKRSKMLGYVIVYILGVVTTLYITNDNFRSKTNYYARRLFEFLKSKLFTTEKKSERTGYEEQAGNKHPK
jgi:hypothetical protein